MACILSGCNTWIGKQYTNTVARYNKIYHAQKKIRETDEDIKKAYKDDFNKILPVFNLGDENSLKGNGGEMDKVLKKTSKVIEKYPKSKWTDNAWFLMGQSYFYRGDFFAAIENFEFVSSKYKNTDIAYRANLWTLYSYILMGKESESLSIITKLKNEKNFPEKYKKGLFFSAAEIAIKQNKPTIAVENLNNSLKFLKNKNDKIRAHYILGQLYLSLDSFNQASTHFNKVIKYNPEYDFNFNAQINLASALVRSEAKSYKKARNVLERMLKDDKNIEYYARIYYELGKVDELAGKNNSAIENYKSSLHQNGTTNILKTDAYNSIANIYFEQGNFLKSDLYYDSANTTLTEDHPNFEALSKKRENQSELLENLVILQKNDSLLMLAENPKRLEAIIDEQIKEEKLLAERQKAIEENRTNSGPASNNPMNNSFPNNQNNNNNNNSVNASFPFYDPISRATGYNSFIGVWGERKNTDNWRVSSLASNISTEDLNEDEDTTSVQNETVSNEQNNQEIPPNVPIDRKKYYENIPFSKEAKAKLIKENEEAAFKLALLYFYDLDNPNLALKYLNILRSKYPNAAEPDRIIYELAKVNKQLGNSEAYNKNFDELALKHPESKYLKALKNELIDESESAKSGVSKEVQELYNLCYNLFKNKEYDQVLSKKKMHDINYAGNPLQANFDYLEAMTFAKQSRMNDYKQKLESIIASYPNTAVSQNAQRNLDAYNTKQLLVGKDTTGQKSSKSKQLFNLDKSEEHYTLLILPLKFNTNQIKNKLNDYHKTEYSLMNIEVTELIISNQKVILIKGFGNVNSNKSYAALLTSKKIINKKTTSSIIGKSNVTKVLQKQNLEAYLSFANTVYK